MLQISKALGINSKIAATIKKIEAEQLYQQDMDEKFYALNKFEVSLTVFDNTKILDIQNGLIYYFENNQFIRNYHERYQESNINICDVNETMKDISWESRAIKFIVYKEFYTCI